LIYVVIREDLLGQFVTAGFERFFDWFQFVQMPYMNYSCGLNDVLIQKVLLIVPGTIVWILLSLIKSEKKDGTIIYIGLDIKILMAVFVTIVCILLIFPTYYGCIDDLNGELNCEEDYIQKYKRCNIYQGAWNCLDLNMNTFWNQERIQKRLLVVVNNEWINVS
jgi:hypothetical protein